MIIPQKLRLIQEASGWTQAQIALRLGVTFAAHSRWLHGHATPRPKAQEAIDALLRELTGQRAVPEHLLQGKKLALRAKAKRTPGVLRRILSRPDLRDAFRLALTYTSNRLEGSTLTEGETAQVLFDNVTLPNRTLIEQMEAKNHAAALDALFTHLAARNPINEALVLRLHAILMNAVRDDAGFYRRHGVRIVGAHVPTANYLRVPERMDRLIPQFRRRTSDMIALAAETHARFEQIHPFADGNGRIGRLLLHAVLLRANFPPALVLPEHRRAYLSALETAQVRGDHASLELFLCDAVGEGWKLLGPR